MKRGLVLFLLFTLIIAGAASCGSPDAQPTTAPTIVAALPSATPLPPTPTPVPPTETPLPPTPTPVPPTETPPPPTQTPIPPTATPLPPTATPTNVPEPTATLDPTVFELRSPAFGREESIPDLYTCKGDDISPPLEWGEPPAGTQSLVMLMNDITAPNLVHWVFWNIPPDTRSLPESVPTRGHLDDGSQQGTNHIFQVGYFGPCPMPGPNRYRFRLYALDTMLDLEDGAMMIPVKQAMKGHILAETELIGLYP
jgi:Raf kinase inhibitor-like YbhB/YbcL family protein